MMSMQATLDDDSSFGRAGRAQSAEERVAIPAEPGVRDFTSAEGAASSTRAFCPSNAQARVGRAARLHDLVERCALRPAALVSARVGRKGLNHTPRLRESRADAEACVFEGLAPSTGAGASFAVAAGGSAVREGRGNIRRPTPPPRRPSARREGRAHSVFAWEGTESSVRAPRDRSRPTFRLARRAAKAFMTRPEPDPGRRAGPCIAPCHCG
jgi:hypothetical protein